MPFLIAKACVTHWESQNLLAWDLLKSAQRSKLQLLAKTMRETGITTRWVNSDRQVADVLTKPNAPSHSLQALQSTGRWKIVFDDNFTSAKKLRKAARDQNLKKNTQSSLQRALLRSIGQEEWKSRSQTTTQTHFTACSSTTTPTTKKVAFRSTPQIRTYKVDSEEARKDRTCKPQNGK